MSPGGVFISGKSLCEDVKCTNGNFTKQNILKIDYCLQFYNAHEKPIALLSGYDIPQSLHAAV